MRHRGLVTSLACLSLLAAPRPADAWGFEAHKYIMQRAIALLPAELRPFFQKHAPSIVEHVIDPDLWRTAGWEEEPPRHFLDMDAYGPHPFSAVPRDYDEAVRRFGREFVHRNGLLPWRTAEIHARLVEAFTQKTGYARENIKFFSSVLTHYVSDAHVPFHAASNHDGQLTRQWGIHSRFETELFERYRLKLRVAPGPIGAVGPVRDFVFATLTASFPLTHTILDADRAAVGSRATYDDGYFTRFFERVRPILERRLADSITGSASLITSAWIEAGRPPVRVQESRSPRRVRRE